MRSTLTLCALALLTGCATIGPGTEDQVCAGWKPILISQADVLTEETARQIEGHNLNGEANGCWKRPR